MTGLDAEATTVTGLDENTVEGVVGSNTQFRVPARVPTKAEVVEGVRTSFTPMEDFLGVSHFLSVPATADWGGIINGPGREYFVLCNFRTAFQ